MINLSMAYYAISTHFSYSVGSWTDAVRSSLKMAAKNFPEFCDFPIQIHQKRSDNLNKSNAQYKRKTADST